MARRPNVRHMSLTALRREVLELRRIADAVAQEAADARTRDWAGGPLREYLRITRFAPYSDASSEEGMIVTRYALDGEPGKLIEIPFIGRRSTGGREEDLVAAS